MTLNLKSPDPINPLAQVVDRRNGQVARLEETLHNLKEILGMKEREVRMLNEALAATAGIRKDLEAELTKSVAKCVLLEHRERDRMRRARSRSPTLRKKKKKGGR